VSGGHLAHHDDDATKNGAPQLAIEKLGWRGGWPQLVG
jgi:hypothetical protein